jgi:hypothetical protein
MKSTGSSNRLLHLLPKGITITIWLAANWDLSLSYPKSDQKAYLGITLMFKELNHIDFQASFYTTSTFHIWSEQLISCMAGLCFYVIIDNRFCLCFFNYQKGHTLRRWLKLILKQNQQLKVIPFKKFSFILKI